MDGQLLRVPPRNADALMCGICGSYSIRTATPIDTHTLGRMVDAMSHRGPDDRGVFVDKDLGMGMRRLSIIDLEGGKQPISNEDGHVRTVLNGEIYNFRELRVELQTRGHVFRTRSDTEVLVHAYEEWGVSCLGRLNGMFGLAIWDGRNRMLILARDTFGVKPLYYARPAGDLVFASEIRPLLLEGRVPRAVSWEALGQYISLTYVPSPLTMFEGINRLRPGHYLLCSAEGGIQERCFASNEQETFPSWNRAEEVIPELRKRIAAAVERQMVADVPVGVMLSGGVDSSAIAAIASGHADDGIDAFTVGFGNDYARNEVEMAADYARSIGARHFSVQLDRADYMNSLERCVYDLEEPVASASTVAFRAVCKLARERVKVVLTGQGADEPFAGYHRYLGLRYANAYRSLPVAVRDRMIAPLVELLPRSERLKRAVRSLGEGSDASTLARVYSVVDDALKERLLGVPIRDDGGERAAAYWLSSDTHRSLLDTLLYADARLSLADNLLLYGDKMSMAVSLEARVPFLDLDLMRLAESIPAQWKIKGFDLKHLWKQALSEWVPESVLRRRKIGFDTPVDQWFRSGLEDGIAERLVSNECAAGEYIDRDEIKRLVREHRDGRHDHKRILFSVLVFDTWVRRFMTGDSQEDL